jgi:hypothetical protein
MPTDAPATTCLWLVEQVDAILESILKQREKGLAMRLLVQRLATIRPKGTPDLLEVRCEVEKGFGSQEKSVTNTLPPRQCQCPAEGVAVRPFCVGVAARSALRAVAECPGETLEQRGLTRAVLSNEKGDWRVEGEIETVLEDRNRERMRSLDHAILVQADMRQEGTAGQRSCDLPRTGRSFSSAHRGRPFPCPVRDCERLSCLQFLSWLPAAPCRQRHDASEHPQGGVQYADQTEPRRAVAPR